jgi:hypothetical protein
MTYLSFFALSFAGGALAGGVVALIVARRAAAAMIRKFEDAARATPGVTQHEMLAAIRAFDQTRREAAHAREVAQGAAFTARMANRRGARS